MGGPSTYDPEYQRSYYEARKQDPEWVERRRAYSRKWYRQNKERAAAAFRLWQQTNPDKIAGYNRKHKATRRGAPGSFTEKEWAVRLDYFGHRCAYCLGSGQRLTVDHMVPVSLGGANDIDNLVPACGACNSGKRNRSILTMLGG